MRYGIGLDIGIASTGYAVMELNEDDRPIKIIRIGSRVFDKPENPKDGASPAVPRREARSMRRRVRRRKHRKERIRNLIQEAGMLSAEALAMLFNGKQVNVYALRCRALDCVLSERCCQVFLSKLSKK